MNTAGGMVAVPAAALQQLTAMGGHMLPELGAIVSTPMAQSVSHIHAGAALLQQVGFRKSQLHIQIEIDSVPDVMALTPMAQSVTHIHAAVIGGFVQTERKKIYRMASTSMGQSVSHIHAGAALPQWARVCLKACKRGLQRNHAGSQVLQH